MFAHPCEMVGLGEPTLGSRSPFFWQAVPFPRPAPPLTSPWPAPPCPSPIASVVGEGEWYGGFFNWIPLFNIKSRAHNCIKTCIIILEEGRAQPLVIAGLL